MASEMDTCEVYFERDVDVSNEESYICTGDGTICVECGKSFTHPFYFSTHISSHACQRDFVVVGQCALCGLVFSDEKIFAAHMLSSQSRMDKQVIPENDDLTDLGFSDAEPELSSQTDAPCEENNFETDIDVSNKINNTSADENVGSDMIDEQKPKRKRKAPDRFDPDQDPQLTSIKVGTDPEVEAYLMSLQQMGLTVDPAAFARHRGGKNGRKAGGKRGRGRKGNTVLENAGQDIVPPKKASPKYEYVDVDDSPDDDPEVQPINGKLTRGQRLEQRKERLNQLDESSKNKDIKVPIGASLDAEEVEFSKDISQTGEECKEKSSTPELQLVKLEETTECSSPTSHPADAADISDSHITFTSSSDDKSNICNSLLVSNVDKINTAVAPPVSQDNMINTTNRAPVLQSSKMSSFTPSPRLQGGKINSLTPTPGSKGSKINSFTPSPRLQGDNINLFTPSPRLQGGNSNSFPPSPRLQGGNMHSFIPSPTSQGRRINSFASSPGLQGNKINSFAQSPGLQGNKIHSFTSSPMQGGKINSFTPSPAVRPSPSMYNVDKNSQHRNSYMSSVRGRGNITPIISDKNDIIINLDDEDEQTNTKLEDLKKDSRDNVQHMLQSVGMIALTTSSLAQGKMFSSQKPNARGVSFQPNRRASFNQSIHSRGGFQNRPFGVNNTLTPLQKQYTNGQIRFRPNTIGVRGRAGSSSTWTNNHTNPQRHQVFRSPQNLINNTNFTGLYHPGTNYSRGYGNHGVRGQHTYNNLRGTISSVPPRGKIQPIRNTVHSAGVFRGHGNTTTVNKQRKICHSSNEIIVIDDDNEGVEVISIDDDDNISPDFESNENDTVCLIADVSSMAETSDDNKTSKERDADIGAILECAFSGFKTNKDKENESSAEPAMNVEDSSTCLQPPVNEDESVENVESDTEVENELLISSLNRHIKNSADPITPEYKQTGKESDLCENKVDVEDNSADGLNENVDIMPGEDIQGWKVCLAEDSNSDDDNSTSSVKPHKESFDGDYPLTQEDQTKKDNNYSSPIIETIQERLQQNTSSDQSCQNVECEKLDHSPLLQIETNLESPTFDHLLQQDQTKQNHYSSSVFENNQETPQHNDSSSDHSCQKLEGEKLEHSLPLQIENSQGSPTCGNCSPDHTSLSCPEMDNSLTLNGVLIKIDSNTMNNSEQENMQLCSDVEEKDRHNSFSQKTYSERQETNMETETDVDQDNMVAHSPNSLDEYNVPCWSVKSKSEQQNCSNITSSFQDNFAAFINRLPEVENKAMSMSHLDVDQNIVHCEIDTRENIPQLCASATNTKINPVNCGTSDAITTDSAIYHTDVDNVTKASAECTMLTDNTTIDSINCAMLTSDITTGSVKNTGTTGTTNSITSATLNIDSTAVLATCAMLTDTTSDSANCAMVADTTTDSAQCVMMTDDTTTSASKCVTLTQTPYHSIDYVCDSISSHSLAAQSSVIATDFVTGENCLLDIFTEIEKTCKEMVETVDNETKEEQQANKETEVVEEKMVLLDNRNNLKSADLRKEELNEFECSRVHRTEHEKK